MTGDDGGLQLVRDALRVEADGQRRLLAGEDGRPEMLQAAALYRRSWEAAPPEAFGRLVGMLKAAVIGGAAGEPARFARVQLPDPPPGPTAAYALAIACLVEGDDVTAAAATRTIADGDDAFRRAAAAIVALARRDDPGYREAIAAILEDFESRDAHATGVPICDTVLMLERLAEPRGLAAAPQSRLLPPR